MIKSFGYYGTVGDQINETRGAVNRLWVCNFDGDIQHRRANILSAGLPVTLDVEACLWARPKTTSKQDVAAADVLLPDARERLRKMQDDLGDAWRFVDSIVLIDEPNHKGHAKPLSLPAAANLVRAVWPDKKLAVIYTSGKPSSPELFDWVGYDDYKRGDKALWDWWAKLLPFPRKWGGVYRIQKKMRKDADLILVPGGAEPKLKPASIDKWVRYAEKQKRNVHIIAFLWRSPAAHLGLVGIADQPELREQYLSAGRRAVP